MPWTALQPSRRARRWRQVGLSIAAASTVALLAAAAASTPSNSSLAVLSGVAALLAWAAARERRAAPLEIGVASSGEIMLRDAVLEPAAEPFPAPALQISFAAPWLISLRRGTMLVSIWPDSVPPPIYRRLWVHLHWAKAAPSDDDQRSTSSRRGRPKVD